MQIRIVKCLKIFKISDVINFITKAIENWESGISNKRINPRRGKSPKGNLLGRLTLATTICYYKNTIELYTQEIHRRQQIQKSLGKYKPPCICKISAKNKKRQGNPYTNYENIQPGDRNGIWDGNMFYANNEKWERERNRTTKSKRLQKKKITNTWEHWQRTPSTEMKEKVRKEYLRKTCKLLETKYCSRILIKWINTWAAPLPWNIFYIIHKMSREELK